MYSGETCKTSSKFQIRPA